MKKVLVFAGSNSSVSINKKLAVHASNQLKNAEITILDLNNFEMPIYSHDREENGGIPQLAKNFADHLKESDGVIVSFAEHNSNFTAAFKNILEWVSRLKLKSWSGKNMLIMSASPGERGGKSVLEIANPLFARFGANVAATFSLPFFGDHFSEESGIKDPDLNDKFGVAVSLFTQSVFKD